MQSKIITLISLVATLGVVQTTIVTKALAEADKITICHAAGQSDTSKFVTLTLARNAVYQDQGNGGHFFENGTPKAGHENDYVGECRTEATVTPSATPTPTSNPSPTATATPITSTTSTNTTSSTNTDNGATNTNTNETGATGQVLGSYAETGVAEDVMMGIAGSLGSAMTIMGSLIYGKKKTKKQ